MVVIRRRTSIPSPGCEAQLNAQTLHKINSKSEGFFPKNKLSNISYYENDFLFLKHAPGPNLHS